MNMDPEFGLFLWLVIYEKRSKVNTVVHKQNMY
jgi:hypothetical protein